MTIDYSKMSVYGDTYGNTQENLDATQQNQETGIAEILIPNINTPFPNINTPYLNSGDNNQYYNNNQLTALRDKALATRQKNLNNPGKIQGILNSGMGMLGMTPQRSTLEMMTSGEKDLRKTSGIPFLPGGLIAKMLPDNYYDKMTLGDQIFTQSQMTNKALPTVFNSGNTTVNKDEFGINIRSMFGNYGEYAVKRTNQLNKRLTEIGKDYGATWDAALGEFTSKGKTKKQEEAAAFANKRTTMLKSMFSKYSPLKYQYQAIPSDLKLIKQAQDIKKKKISFLFQNEEDVAQQEIIRKAAAQGKAQGKAYDYEGRDTPYGIHASTISAPEAQTNRENQRGPGGVQSDISKPTAPETPEERRARIQAAANNAQRAANQELYRTSGGGDGGQPGSAPTGTAGRNPWGKAKGGLIRKPYSKGGRIRYGEGGIVTL